MVSGLKKDKMIDLIIRTHDNFLEERTLRGYIDKMETDLGFYITDYADRFNTNGDAINYDIPLNIAGLIASYAYIKIHKIDFFAKKSKYKRFTEDEKMRLKAILEQNFSKILDGAEEYKNIYGFDAEVIEDFRKRANTIVQNQFEKILKQQEYVKYGISKKDEIRNRFNEVIYSKVRTSNYYNFDVEATEAIEKRSREVDELQRKILQIIQEFEESE